MVRSEGGGCPAEDALLSFVDGRGSAEDRARVEQHMDECDDCRAAISALAAASPPPVDAISSAPTLPDTGDPPPAATGGGTLSPGTRLGRYVITALEGKGGMGEVYAAEDPALGRRVAIKVLRRDLSSGSAGSLEERLAREAQAMARLNHPAVVTVYDVGELDGRIFIAMEYVAGQTLAGWLAAEERPWRQVLARFIAAGRGLAAAHAAGLVHRDFKPENVLLGEDGRPRVADFGVARPLGVIEAAAPAGSPGTSPLLASSLTATGAVIGTPIYMAPEQLRGEPATPASDQFSFCASLYVGLHGARPFSGDTVTSLMKEVERGALREPPPGEQRVPAQVRRAVARGLASDPADRFPSMDALLSALERAGRRRWPAALAAAAGAVVIAGAAALGHQLGAGDEVGPCGGAAARLGGVWDEERAAAVSAALAATGVPYAAAVAREVNRELDDYAVRWRTMHVEACRATRVHRHQTEAQLALRMRCLDRRLAELDALVDRLIEADGDTAAAPGAVRRLPDVSACAEVDRLAAVPPPADPAARAEIEARTAELALVRASYAAGAYRRGLELADPLGEAARALGYRPLEAEVLWTRARLRDELGDYAGAEEDLERAVWAAEAGRHDEIAAQAWIDLIGVVGHRQSRTAEVPALEERATAALERVGRRGEIAVALDRARAVAAYDRGDYHGAAALYRKVLQHVERHRGPDDPGVVEPLRGLSQIALQLGKPQEAAAHQERVLALQRRRLSDSHPEVATTLELLAGAEYMSDRLDEAEQHYRQALAIREAALGAQHPAVGNTLHNLGLVLGFQGRPADSIAALRRAVAIDEKALGPRHPTTAIHMTSLATALETESRLDEARDLLERAIEILREHHGGDHPAIANNLHILGLVRLAAGDAAGALEAAQESHAMSLRVVGPDYPAAEVLRTIGAAHLALGEPRAAIEPLTRASEAHRGREDPADYLWSAALLARALHDSGRDRAAGSALAVEVERRMRGDDRLDHERDALATWMRRRGIARAP